MTFPKLLIGLTVVLFGSVIAMAVFKNSNKKSTNHHLSAAPIEIPLQKEIRVVKAAIPAPQPVVEKVQKPVTEEKVETKTTETTPEALPEANRINELFNTSEPKLPIVETITYKSRVNWQQGRPAWLSDYARHYQTSRHFIARSLNGEADYLKQDVYDGDKFNVLRLDKSIEFYLLVDLSQCKMWLYYDDLDAKERVLLKTYPICVGRVDGSRVSGFLTPLGQYTLGNKIATYKPKIMGFHNGSQIEMISLFGTRWIPFDKEVAKCTAPAKGFGIHGVPWPLSKSGQREEDKSSLGKYESDGCIRLSQEDVEELFAIIITKPTVIELVKDFHEASYKRN